MGHAESPSLISLGLAADDSQEGSSFRWGLATSCFLHALLIVMAVFIRFQPTIEEPFRAIDVALISLPDRQTPAPSKAKASPPAPSLPKVQPKEETLPPLPTQTASERLSEFLGGAIGSIVVPNKQDIAPSTTPSQIQDPTPPKDESPLIENVRLPSAAPHLSRPERLQPAEPLKIPKINPTPPRQKSTQPPMVTSEPTEPVSPPHPAQPVEKESAVKPVPALPELSHVTPFKRTQKDRLSDDSSASATIEDSLKRSIPTIPNPAPSPTIKRKPKPLPTQREKSSVPKMSAPQLSQIHPSQPLGKIHPPVEMAPPREKMAPPREKMSKMMEQLLGEVKVPTLKPSPATPLPSKPLPSSAAPSPKPVQSEIDQRIAKLSIPNVTPVESIKKRLQLLEEPSASTSGNPVSHPSPGRNRYLAMVEDKIDQQWVAPPLIATAPVVVLKFHIARSGEISNIHIDESSGNGHYDSAALRAVHAVNPLPPFPSDISDSFFEVRYQFIKKEKT